MIDSNKLKYVLLLAKYHASKLGINAELKHDDADGEFYQDQAMHQVMCECEQQVKDIDEILNNLSEFNKTGT